MPRAKSRASKDEAGNTLRKRPAEEEPADFERITEGAGEAGSSKDRSSQSASGIGRGQSIDDELAELYEAEGLGSVRGRTFKPDSGRQPGEFQGIGEDVVAKPRTVSVARSARGRPPKAKSSPASGRSPADALTSKLIRIASAVMAVLCLLGLINHLASRTDVGDQASPLPGLSEDEPSPRFNDVVDWIKENGPWGPRQASKSEERVDIMNNIQLLEGVALPAVPRCVCPQCHVRAKASACPKDQGYGFAMDGEPYPTFLAPYMTSLPSVQDDMRDFLDFWYRFMADHPWWFLLVVIFAAAKILEPILLVTNLALEHALKLTRRFDQRMQEAAVSDEDLVDQKTERASKVGDADLLVQTRSKGKEDADPEGAGVSK